MRKAGAYKRRPCWAQSISQADPSAEAESNPTAGEGGGQEGPADSLVIRCAFSQKPEKKPKLTSRGRLSITAVLRQQRCSWDRAPCPSPTGNVLNVTRNHPSCRGLRPRFLHCCSSQRSARAAACISTRKTGNLQQIRPSFLRAPAKSHTPGTGSSLSTEKAEASIPQLNLEPPV